MQRLSEMESNNFDRYEVANDTGSQCPSCGVWPGQFHRPDCPEIHRDDEFSDPIKKEG
jgi:hypothetical protein